MFYPGMKTYYRSKVAYLIECINEDAPEDIRLQGRLWYIDSDGIRYSVTESELQISKWSF